MIRTITTGPFGWFFTNINTEMAIPGHSHFAQVTFHWRTMGSVGFPSFESTYKILSDQLRGLGDKPFRNYTNEKVADFLFESFQNSGRDPAIALWNGNFCLWKVELAVRGVLDRIGHADGFTVYTVEREADFGQELRPV